MSEHTSSRFLLILLLECLDVRSPEVDPVAASAAAKRGDFDLDRKIFSHKTCRLLLAILLSQRPEKQIEAYQTCTPRHLEEYKNRAKTVPDSLWNFVDVLLVNHL